jgi:hypothetical protein
MGIRTPDLLHAIESPLGSLAFSNPRRLLARLALWRMASWKRSMQVLPEVAVLKRVRDGVHLTDGCGGELPGEPSVPSSRCRVACEFRLSGTTRPRLAQ